ncbi:2-oxo acid dehydrogenase subunit E2, partial [Microbacterium sp. ISL-103]|uniref:2-oxo acid dehydrogenase subunit E2 n=1 Tax=Microbacterium sp. ISL-103 TaxID=2819156 RepID=UPI0020359CAA
RVGDRGAVSDAASPAAGVPRDASTLQASSRETRIPIRGVRKHTAAAMVESAFTAPHVTIFHTVDVTATMDLLASFRDDRALVEHRIGPLAVVAKAVCLALGRTPGLNSHWDETSQEIVQYHYVDLGIA